ncbi:allantoate amidohydrolase [Massilia sp. W12]|uniref:allantoate amidohydrolase n=1 Tax=Massilia sp. W12 TaxID=3126507 RepID=UPI0030D4360F
MQTGMEEINRLTLAEFVARFGAIYEHSPWVAEAAFVAQPFASLAALKLALARAVEAADEGRKRDLLNAHPELAGKLAIAGKLGQHSSAEQAGVGLHLCTPEEFTRLHELNEAYRSKFGFPFIIAVKGDHGLGLSRADIIADCARRLENDAETEFAESLYQVKRIAEMRLDTLFGVSPAAGQTILARAQSLAAHSDEPAQLSVSYLSPAHQAVAAQLMSWMEQAGMRVWQDAVGNVVGRYAKEAPEGSVRKTLLIGSHYDTVKNGGRYDGRLGILLGIAAVQILHEEGCHLPFDIEVIGFADEEGVRFQSTFLGSRALAGNFNPALLEKTDAQGVSMREALQQAGLDAQEVVNLARDPARLAGYLEAHIEQGPVLLQADMPLGVVTSIAGCSRFLLELRGQAGHAGTAPMNMRRDSAAAAAEIVLAVEQICSSYHGRAVGTVGQLMVEQGSINVVPGKTRLSLDLRSGEEKIRYNLVQQVLNACDRICKRRRIELVLQPVLDQAATPCNAQLQNVLAQAIADSGLPVMKLASGAGHDAMCMARITPIAMLFVRCGHGGVSHHPLESMTAHDAELALSVMLQALRNWPVEIAQEEGMAA